MVFKQFDFVSHRVRILGEVGKELKNEFELCPPLTFLKQKGKKQKNINKIRLYKSSDLNCLHHACQRKSKLYLVLQIGKKKIHDNC